MTLSCPSQTPRRDWLSLPVIIPSAVLLFLAACLLFSPFVADDAYIVGRYALNAAEGNGLVYNLGERVSALTSPLHALLEAGLALTGLDPVAAYRILAPFLVLVGWVVAVRQAALGASAAMLFGVIALASPFMALWTVGGLETPILAMLAVLFVARLVVVARKNHATTADFLWLGALAGLMFVTRYDSVLVSAPPLVALLTLCWRRPGLWLGAALCVAVAGSWLAFAALYYGDIFPTSYYLKFSFGGRPQIDSISATLNFLLLSGVWLLAFSVRLSGMAKRSLMARALLRGAMISAMLFLVYALQAAGQHMMFGYRMFVPYLPAAGLLLTLAVPADRHWVASAILAWQGAMIAIVSSVGVNPAPLTRLPGLQAAYAEYEFITPRSYGLFMDMLREDSREIAAHWRNTGKPEVPRIYLRTGGTGYWLRDFYVYESLVSFRQGCGDQLGERIRASHYMQQMDMSQLGDIVRTIGQERPDVMAGDKLLFSTVIDWMGQKETGYLYGPDPSALVLGPEVDSPCRPSSDLRLSKR